ncbi:hypothetical protein LINPERPRIM_LOCUS30537 [Linum perenne]
MQEDVELNPRCPRVSFSGDEIKSFYRPWSKALVVKVLEKYFSFGAVKRRLEAIWARNGYIQVSDISNSFFLVRFADPDDYHRAAFGGPWKIFYYYFSVARWTPEFNEEEPLKTILTWVRMPRLHIHFFNRLAVTRIGNYIRMTVKLDLETSEGARARYARVCVEVDLSKPLLRKYMINNRTFFIEYKSLENISATCGFYGHKADQCLPLDAPDPTTMQKQGADSNVTIPGPEQVGDAGDWMVVQRRGKGKGRKELKMPTKQPKPRSRFTTLANKEGEASVHAASLSDVATIAREKVDSTTADLAARLAEALQQAPHMQKTGETSTVEVAMAPTPRNEMSLEGAC